MTETGIGSQTFLNRVRIGHWLVPLAVAVSAGLAVLVLVGTLPVLQALLAGASTWTMAGLALAATLRRRDHRSKDDRERLSTLEDLHARFGIAEHLGAFGTFLIERTARSPVWSAGAFRLFGSDSNGIEPTLREFTEAIHPQDRRLWIDLHRKAMREGGEAKLEYRFLRDGGEPIWIRSIARAETGRAGRIERLAGVAQDITSMRAMRQQLAESEAKFRDLTNMSSDWVWETDLDYRWSFFSDGAEALFGPWIASLIGRRLWDLQDNEAAFGRPDWRAQRALMTSRAPFEDFEYALVSPDRKPYFIALSGRPAFGPDKEFVGYRGVGRDITREVQQRMLLRFESDLAALIRERSDPEQVVTAIIGKVCSSMGWVGGVNIAPIRKRRSFTVRERAGDKRFMRMVSQLPSEFTLEDESAEARVWSNARPEWIEEVRAHPLLEKRFRAEELGARAAFLAPIVDENGKPISLLLALSPSSFRDDGFLMRFAEALSRNLSLFLQRQAAERRLLHQSLHDALTDLPNRMYLARQLDQRLARDEPAALLYIDLDRYKIINDTLGHAVGDQVLVEVARRMKEMIRPEDLACRIGGDEFIVLLTRLSDRAEIERIGRRVLAAIEKPFMLMNRAHFLSASIGVAIAPNDAQDSEHLIKCADSAMYRVKSEGRNDIRFFAGGMSDERTEQLALASELPMAMKRGDVEFHYQPILDLEHGEVIGIEALMRWNHPTRGVLLPERFLPIAEQSKLIREIGQWALRRVLDDRVAIGLDEFPQTAVSFNVSPRQLTDEDFLAYLKSMLAERGFPGRLLRLELTESAFIENPERTSELISELRQDGVQVIIDNFGTGYASLSYLKNLPVDGLKIDRSFVRNLTQDRGNMAIVQSITTLAARLGLQAMALGVETAADLRVLRESDCHLLQGALICDPLPKERLLQFLQAQQQSRLSESGRFTGT